MRYSCLRRSPGRPGPALAAGFLTLATLGCGAARGVPAPPPAPVVATDARQNASLDPAAESEHLRLPHLDRQPAAIGGRVLDEDGTPLAGARVEALQLRHVGADQALIAAAAAVSDERGAYRLPDLPAGEYYVSAIHPAFDVSAGGTGYGPTYYPGAVFPDAATPVSLEAGAEAAGIDIRLQLVRSSRVSGRVRSADGRPLLTGVVLLRPLGPVRVLAAPSADATISPDGTFRFSKVPAGRYLLRARGMTEASGTPRFASFQVGVDGRDVDDIELALEPGGIIEGHVAFESASRRPPSDMSRLRVRASAAGTAGSREKVTAAVGPDGRFVLPDLEPGPHTIQVDGLPAPWVLRGVYYQGRPLAEAVLDVETGRRQPNIRLVFSDEGVTAGEADRRR
jgi:hypothetical protein